MASEQEPVALDDAILDQLLHLPLPGAQLRMAAMQVRAALGPVLAAAEQRGREAEREQLIAEIDAIKRQLGQAGGTGIAGEYNAQMERNVVGPWLDLVSDAAAIRKGE